jgi:hypothetical protein
LLAAHLAGVLLFKFHHLRCRLDITYNQVVSQPKIEQRRRSGPGTQRSLQRRSAEHEQKRHCGELKPV